MSDTPMFPGFDAIPEVPPEQLKKAVVKNIRYYLRIQAQNGDWYFLWKTHSNGGCDWRPESELNHKCPLRYKTIIGASRQLQTYTNGILFKDSRVAVWEGKQS